MLLEIKKSQALFLLLLREASLYETETDPYKVRTHIRRTFYYSPEDMNLQRAIDKDLLAFVFVRHPFSRLVSGEGSN